MVRQANKNIYEVCIRMRASFCFWKCTVRGGRLFNSSKHIVQDVEGFEFGESGDVETVVVGQL